MSWTVALPEVVLAVGTMALLMLGVFRGNQSTTLVAILSAVLVVIVLGLSVFGQTGEAFGGLFVENGITAFVKILTLVGSAVGIIMAMDFFRREGMQRFEYPLLMLTATLGMMLMVSANDFIALYMGIELQSLSLYVLAAFRRDSLRSTEAGLKYFVLGALSSGLLQQWRGRAVGRRGWHCVRGRWSSLQDFRRSIPHVDAGCLRGRADTYHGILCCSA